MTTTTREAFLALVHDERFLRRALLHAVNHRVQDFPDPLTTTLVLMATSPMQLVLCETGLLLFKTNLLPVLPYGLLKADEVAQFRGWIDPLPAEQLHETVEPNGQYTLSVPLLLPPPSQQQQPAGAHAGTNNNFICKRTLLRVFVGLMLQNPTDAHRTLCHIVLQRFWSRVPTPSDTVQAVMDQLSPPSRKRSRSPSPSL